MSLSNLSNMLRFVKMLLVLVVACNTGSSSTFYVDPLLGDINNNGSITAPWSTLSAVIANNFIESKEYSPLPYDENTSTEVVKNADAPVHSGDTIILLSGLHGATIIDSYLNDEMITIMAAEGHTPILDYVRFRASRNWRLIGVHVSSERILYRSTPCLGRFSWSPRTIFTYRNPQL